MDYALWVQAFGVLIGLVTGLVGILFGWLRHRISEVEARLLSELHNMDRRISDRMRSLGHEDRDIRGQLDGMYKILIERIYSLEKTEK